MSLAFPAIRAMIPVSPNTEGIGFSIPDAAAMSRYVSRNAAFSLPGVCSMADRAGSRKARRCRTGMLTRFGLPPRLASGKQVKNHLRS